MTGDGWKPLINLVVLAAKDEGVKIAQIKEKFGELRIYVGSNASQRLLNLINEAENLSSTICEYCGKPGHLRTNRSWLKTLCEECNVVRS
jgi:hypothetical protein